MSAKSSTENNIINTKISTRQHGLLVNEGTGNKSHGLGGLEHPSRTISVTTSYIYILLLIMRIAPPTTPLPKGGDLTDKLKHAPDGQ